MSAKFKLFFVGLVSCALLTGCASTKVKRVDIDDTIDLSGRWNDSDSRMVAEEMIQDSLSRPWVDVFQAKENRQPVVIVGPVNNKSHEQIEPGLFTKDLERAFLNSGRVDLVASSDERIAVRMEREDQQKGYTDPDTIKRIGREIGADYIIIGSINSVKDEVKGKYVILYQVNLELIDLETNAKEWIGQKEIKKVVKRSRFGF